MLADSDEIVVGRGSNAHLIVVGSMVSRQHARFELRDGSLSLRDLGSTNGTFVNGDKIKERGLMVGDRVLIGTTILKVELSESPLGTRPPPPPMEEYNEDQTGDHSRMAGLLSDVGVPELIEMFGSARQQVTLEISSGRDGLATIALSEGKVMDCRIAKLPDASARKSMLRVLGYQKGSFAVTPCEAPEERLGIPFPELLVDGLFKLDEMTVVCQQLPGEHSSLVLAKPLLPPLTDLDPEDLQILQLAHNSGNVEDILDKSAETDLQAAKRLLSLLDGGYLRKA